MGEVAYYIDDELKSKHNLYNDVNIPERQITTFEGLSEDKEHTFRAVATGVPGERGGNLIDAGKVVVYHTPYPVTDFTITNPDLKLSEGGTYKIEITNIVPSYASVSDLSFTSENPAVVRVSEDGTIFAESEGQTTLTVQAKNGGLSKQINVVVEIGTPEMSGTIVDTNIQYTQDRYDSIKDQNQNTQTLTAWKNDKALSEIVLVSKDLRLKNVTVTSSDLVGDAGTIEASNVKASFIKSTKAYHGPFLGYGNPNNPYPTETENNRRESSDILYQDASQAMEIESNKL